MQLVADYTAIGRMLARFVPALYVGARLLYPPADQPHLVAATGFMHVTDNTLDRGSGAVDDYRAARCAKWRVETRTALDTGRANCPVLRALSNTAGRYKALGGSVCAYLDAAPVDLCFTGFATESDYQRYVDEYTLPAFLVPMSVHCPDEGKADYRARLRPVADAAQRLDFLTDLAEDLRNGRLTLPAGDLQRFDVTRGDLEQGRDTPGVRALLEHSCAKTRASLRVATGFLQIIPPAHLPLGRAFQSLQEAQLDAVQDHGPTLTHRPPRQRIIATLGILTASYQLGRGA